jgi:hypothetical protein
MGSCVRVRSPEFTYLTITSGKSSLLELDIP